MKNKLETLARLTSKSARKAFVEEYAQNEIDWLDCLSVAVEHGGWPNDESISSITVQSDTGTEIRAVVAIEFTETVGSGCKDLGFHHRGFAEFEIVFDCELRTIDRIALLESDVDEDFRPGDIY